MYYCHEGAASRGMLPSIPTTLVTNQYQLEKYLKHTNPASTAGMTGVFTAPGSEAYQKYVVTAVASGHVEIDSQGRMNIVWVASEQTGIAYKGGQLVGPTKAVKVVLAQDSSTLHGFPISTAELKVGSCAQCGRPVPH